MNILIEHDVPARMRDGAVLRANVFRLDDGERHPVLLHRTPYGKEGARPSDLVDPVRAARAGYCVVVQDVRGRWSSDGERLWPFKHEFSDGADTVEWCATQPWSDGRVVSQGLSYGGFTSWAAASEKPNGLRAIVTAQSPTRFYGDLFYRGGALNWVLLVGWTMVAGTFVDVLKGALGGRIDPATAGRAMSEILDATDDYSTLLTHLPLNTLPPLRPDDPDFAPFFFDVLSHMDDDFARSLSIAERRHIVDVPAFMLAGWSDLYVGADLESFNVLRDHQDPAVRSGSRILVGPWSHGTFTPSIGDLDFGLRSTPAFLEAGDLTATVLDWLGRRLAPEIAHEPFAPIRLFVQGVNKWRDETEWPLARAVETRFFLGPDGSIDRTAPPADAQARSYVYDPADPCPTVGGAFLPMGTLRPGPLDQAPLVGRPDVLVFTGEPLTTDLEVTGPVEATLHAATSAPDTDWVVKLCDVHPDGTTYNVTDGVLRARFRDGSGPQPVPPGETVRYTIELLPTSMVFKAGHRIRVLISSSDFPRYDRNLNTGVGGVQSSEYQVARQTVRVDATCPSYLTLPIVETQR